jgi:PAP2 superfamily protein
MKGILRSNLALGVIALALHIGLSSSIRADVVTDWNQTANTTLAAGGVRFPPQTRALAIMHAAMFDAVNAIDRHYTPYAIDISSPGASPEAAAAAAAHLVMVTLVPTQQANLNAAYAVSLAQIPDGSAKSDGIALGETVALALLALRSTDDLTFLAPYTPGSGVGAWQPTAPAFGPAVWVRWGNMTPFTLRSGSQFRPEGPPALTSSEYTADFNEVKSLGAVNSATRTSDQTQMAFFWLENSNFTWNRIARLAATEHTNTLVENARLFALLNMAGADAIISGFDTKYAYNFWRPITAIRAGDSDGNNDTLGDPNWTPLAPLPAFATPPHPDYISNHAIYSAAAARVLASFFDNDDFDYTVTTSTSPNGAFRSYNSFSQAAEECGASRIYVGYHFGSAVKHGLNMGKQVGNFAFHHSLKPLKEAQ